MIIQGGISSEAKDAFQAAFEKEVAALFRVSEAGGGVLLSEDKLATIKQTLQNYDSMDGPERRATNARSKRCRLPARPASSLAVPTPRRVEALETREDSS